MTFGIRQKIFLASGGLLLVSLSLLAWISRGATHRGFHEFLEIEEAIGGESAFDDIRSLREELENLWVEDGNFERAREAVVSFGDSTAGAVGVAVFDEQDQLVASLDMPSQDVVAERVKGGKLRVTWRMGDSGALLLEGGLPIHNPEGRSVGRLFPIPIATDDVEIRLGESMVGFDRQLLIAAFGVGVLALLLTGVLTSHIVDPIGQLHSAAVDLGGGDLTRRVKIASKDEIGGLGAAFNQMASDLETAERLRQQLVADVAHEMRTPLTALLGQLEAVQDGLLPMGEETLRSLHEDVVQLSAIVADLQDLAQADAGKLTLDLQSVNLLDEVLWTVRTVSGPDPADSPRVDIDAGLTVLADVQRLRQVLVNLLTNTRRHAPGSVVKVTARQLEKGVEIRISDTGPGIEARHLPRLFDRFYRTDDSRSSATGGAGLGLAIVRGLLELQGGVVAVESSVGVGTTFIVTMPRCGSS